MYEILDIYDKNRNKTGKTVERKEGNLIEKNEYIIAVQCWIINSKGKILLTQRRLDKKYGGMWEPTSGLIKSGENSMEGIKRELSEEIGLNISEKELKLFQTIVDESKDINIIKDIYVVNKDVQITDICFKDGEVIDCKYVTINELKEMIEIGKSFKWFKSFINDYYKVSGYKYLKVMFGTKSGANNNLEYKIDEVNVSSFWNPETNNPKETGGFNFSIENKILRWLVRGDTIYDVTIPDDAEVIDCSGESCPGGVFRANKIIISNPRKVTDEMAMELYKKSDLPEKSYFKAMAGVAVRGYMNTAKQIFKDKINKNNIDLAISEFEDFCNPENDLSNNTEEIYKMLNNFKKSI